MQFKTPRIQFKASQSSQLLQTSQSLIQIVNLMSTIDSKRREIRNHIRAKQINQYKHNQRSKALRAQKYQQEQLTPENVAYTLSITSDLRLIQKIYERYPPQLLINELDLPERKLNALHMIQIYFSKQFFKSLQEVTNKALKMMAEQTNEQILQWLLLIFSYIVEYCLANNGCSIPLNIFLPMLASLVERTNGQDRIGKYINLIIHIIVGKCQWGEQIMWMMHILTKMIHRKDSAEVGAYIQTLYELVTRFQQKINPKDLYEQQIHRNCIIHIRIYHSRSTSYYFLKFVMIVKQYLRQDQIGNIIEVIGLMRKQKFKIGSNGKYSANHIQKIANQIIKHFLTSPSLKIMEFASQHLNIFEFDSTTTKLEEMECEESDALCQVQTHSYQTEYNVTEDSAMEIEQFFL